MKIIRKLLALSVTAAMFMGCAMGVGAAEIRDIFDAEFYSNGYADLKAAFGDNETALYNHYITFGIKEGRMPGPWFNAGNYRINNPDIAALYGDDMASYVKHYLTTGLAEGRDAGGEFDLVSYADRYPDLKAAFGYDAAGLIGHYNAHGKTEGREPISNALQQQREAAKRAAELEAAQRASQTKSSNNTDKNTTDEIRTDYDNGSYSITTRYESGAYTITDYRADGTKIGHREFNDKSNVILLISYQEDGVTVYYRSEFTYDANGAMTSEKNTWANGYSAEITYENGLRTHQIDIHADGIKCELEYYEDGSTTKKSTEYRTDRTKLEIEYYRNGNEKTRIEYDADDNITYRQDYDENGNLISSTP